MEPDKFIRVINFDDVDRLNNFLERIKEDVINVNSLLVDNTIIYVLSYWAYNNNK